MSSKYSDSPIFQVREAAGMTGEEFAAKLGISLGGLRNMERGTLAVSDGMAEKLFVVFGVNPQSVRAKEGTALAQMGGLAYDNKAYEEWQRYTRVDDLTAKAMIENRLKRVRWALEAAVLNDSFFVVDLMIDLALQKIVRQNHLESLINKRLRQDGGEEFWINFDSGSIAVCEHVMAKLDAEQSKADSK